MMKYFLNFLKSALLLGGIWCFLVTATAYGQEKVFSIKYVKGILPTDQYKGKTQEEWTKINFEPTLLKGTVYELVITNQKSYFSLMEKGLTNSGRARQARYRDESIFYVNNRTQEKMTIKESFNKVYHIIHPFNDFDWRLTNEYKMILGHRCRKAIGSQSIFTSDKNGKTIAAKQLLIAWFAEDLPFSFGPNRFNGLPGVILEVFYERYNYVATDIAMRNKPSDSHIIKKPAEGIPITQAEYKEKLVKFVETMKARYTKKD